MPIEHTAILKSLPLRNRSWAGRPEEGHDYAGGLYLGTPAPGSWKSRRSYEIRACNVAGTGDNQHDVFEQQWRYPRTVGSYIGSFHELIRVGSTSTRWIWNMYAGTDEIGVLLPYPVGRPSTPSLAVPDDLAT